MKSLAVLLLVLSFSVSAKAESFFDTPLPICSNIKSYQSYELAKAVKSSCDQQGVPMTLKDLYKMFLPMMTDEFASVSECNTDCWLLDSTSGISMAECVKNNLVGNVVRSFMSSAVFNKGTCEETRSRI
jgi:hypothetical protein